MTRQEAIELYLNVRRKRATKVIERLMLWDATKTLEQNRQVLKMQYRNLSVFKNQFGLKCVRAIGKDHYQINRPLCLDLRKQGFTLAAIGKLYGVSRQRINQIIKGK